jgi:hypothetical protein
MDGTVSRPQSCTKNVQSEQDFADVTAACARGVDLDGYGYTTLYQTGGYEVQVALNRCERAQTDAKINRPPQDATKAPGSTMRMIGHWGILRLHRRALFTPVCHCFCFTALLEPSQMTSLILSHPPQPVLPVDREWLYSCHVHGLLPASSFYSSDLRAHRSRCKHCARSAVSRWRRTHLEHHMWTKLIVRVRRKFGHDAATKFNWRQHGQAHVRRLLKQQQLGDEASPQGWCLTWRREVQGPPELEDLILAKTPSSLKQSSNERSLCS